MVIKLPCYDFDKIMKSCAKFANSRTAKRSSIGDMLTKIELSCDGMNITAVALDGYKLLKTSVPVTDTCDKGKIIVPVMKTLGKDAGTVKIIDEGNDVTVKCDTCMTVYKKFVGKFFDYANIFPKNGPDFVCVYNPKNLIDALGAFDDLDKVKIELFQNAQMVISSPNQKSLVLGWMVS